MPDRVVVGERVLERYGERRSAARGPAGTSRDKRYKYAMFNPVGGGGSCQEASFSKSKG